MMKKMISDVSTVLSICRRPTTSRPPSVTETCGLTTNRTKRWFTEADFALGHFLLSPSFNHRVGVFKENVHRPSIQRTSAEDKFPTKSGGRDRWPIHFPVLLETYFSTWAKMQTSKRKLKSTTQDVSNVNGCKRKINEKCEFWILQISSSLFFSQFKNLIANNDCWYKMKENSDILRRKLHHPNFGQLPSVVQLDSSFMDRKWPPCISHHSNIYQDAISSFTCMKMIFT